MSEIDPDDNPAKLLSLFDRAKSRWGSGNARVVPAENPPLGRPKAAVSASPPSEIASASLNIYKATQSYWQTFRKPMLLSALGDNLSGADREVISRSGPNLRGFIEHYLPQYLTIVNLPKGVLGVTISTGTNINAEGRETARDHSNLVGATELLSAAAARQFFYPSVWYAFINPLGDSARYLEFRDDGSPVRHDQSFDVAAPTEWIRIHASDMPKRVGYDVTISQVRAAIIRWAAMHNIPLQSLFDPNRSQPSSRAVSARQRLHTLATAIDQLSDEDLARIWIPADLVREMLKRADER